jgi:hypothetical protein
VFTCPVDTLVSTLGLPLPCPPPEPLEPELLEFAVLEAEVPPVEVEVSGFELPLFCDNW